MVKLQRDSNKVVVARGGGGSLKYICRLSLAPDRTEDFYEKFGRLAFGICDDAWGACGESGLVSKLSYGHSLGLPNSSIYPKYIQCSSSGSCSAESALSAADMEFCAAERHDSGLYVHCHGDPCQPSQPPPSQPPASPPPPPPLSDPLFVTWTVSLAALAACGVAIGVGCLLRRIVRRRGETEAANIAQREQRAASVVSVVSV